MDRPPTIAASCRRVLDPIKAVEHLLTVDTVDNDFQRVHRSQISEMLRSLRETVSRLGDQDHMRCLGLDGPLSLTAFIVDKTRTSLLTYEQGVLEPTQRQYDMSDSLESEILQSLKVGQGELDIVLDICALYFYPVS